MKDRMTLGHDADVAETAALTFADERATERIYEHLDMEHDERMADIMERRRKSRDERRRARAVERVRETMGDIFADALDAHLHHKSWREIGIPKRTFNYRLKKVKITTIPLRIGASS
jgi:hypothetical protein